MRPLLCAAAILISGALAGVFASGGAAKATTRGDGCLVVSKGFGKVTITLSRGIIFGRFNSGTLWYSDLNSDKTKPPIVPGNVTFTKVNDHLWKYGPADYLSFRTVGGPTKIIVTNATSMDLSVAGKGTAVLWTSHFLQSIAGTYSADAKSFCDDPTSFLKMPLVPTTVPISSSISG
jgi:hypothetical protein